MLPFAAQAAAGMIIDQVFDESNKDNKGSAQFQKYSQLDKTIGEQEPVEIKIDDIDHPTDEIVNDIGRKSVDKDNPRSLYESLSADNKRILESLYDNDKTINKNIKGIAEGIEKVNRNIDKLQKSSELYNKMGLEGMTNIGGGGSDGTVFDKIAEFAVTLATIGLSIKAIYDFLKLGKKPNRTIEDEWKEFVEKNPFKVDFADFNSKIKGLGGEYQVGADLARQTGEHEMKNMQDLLSNQAVLSKIITENKAEHKKSKDEFIAQKKKEVKDIKKAGTAEYKDKLNSGLSTTELNRFAQETQNEVSRVKGEANSYDKSYSMYEKIFDCVKKIQDRRYSKFHALSLLTLTTKDRSYIISAVNQTDKVDLNFGSNSKGVEFLYNNKDNLETISFEDLAAAIISSLGIYDNLSLDKIKDYFTDISEFIYELGPYAKNSFEARQKFEDIKRESEITRYKEAMATMVAFETLGLQIVKDNNSLSDEEKGRELEIQAKAKFGTGPNGEFGTFQQALGLTDKSTGEEIYKAIIDSEKKARKEIENSDEYKSSKTKKSVMDFIQSKFDSEHNVDLFVRQQAGDSIIFNEEEAAKYEEYKNKSYDEVLNSTKQYSPVFVNEESKGVFKDLFGAKGEETASDAIVRKLGEQFSDTGKLGDSLASSIAKKIIELTSGSGNNVQKLSEEDKKDIAGQAAVLSYGLNQSNQQNIPTTNGTVENLHWGE